MLLSRPRRPAAPQQRRVIDTRVEQRQQLQVQTGPDLNVLGVDSLQDDLSAIFSALTRMIRVDSIQILSLSYGSDGQVSLGNRTVSADDVLKLAVPLQKWRAHRTADADIRLDGCDIGAGSVGQTPACRTSTGG